jgi:hypothetical protein
MKKLLFNNAAKGTQVDYGQLEALQEQNLQTVEGIVNTLYPNYNSEVLVIFGCEVTDNGDGTQTTTAGKIYKDGEIYDVAASTVAIADTPIWKLSTVTKEGKFGDGSTYPLRSNKTLSLADGATGSGFSNVAGTVSLIDKVYEWETLKAAKDQGAWTALTLINGWTGTLEYRKTDWGQVEIRGIIDGTNRDTAAVDPPGTTFVHLPSSLKFTDAGNRFFPINADIASVIKLCNLKMYEYTQAGTGLERLGLDIFSDYAGNSLSSATIGIVTIHLVYTPW